MFISVYERSTYLVYSARKKALEHAIPLYCGTERLTGCSFDFSVDEYLLFYPRFTDSLSHLQKHMLDVRSRDFGTDDVDVYLVCDSQTFQLSSLWSSDHVICITNSEEELDIPDADTMNETVHICTPTSVPEMKGTLWNISPSRAQSAIDSIDSEKEMKELFILPELAPFYLKSGFHMPELPGITPFYPLDDFKGDKKQPCALLLSTGALCPVHFMHFRIFDIASLYLKRYFGITTVGAYISPSSDSYVGHKLAENCLSFQVRALMCQKACEDYNRDPRRHPECRFPICTSTWEGEQCRYVSFKDVRNHIQAEACMKYPEYQNLSMFFVCGFDHYYRSNLYRMKRVVAISRQPYVPKEDWLDRVRTIQERNQSFVLLEDLDEELKSMMCDISSTEIRKRVETGDRLDDLMLPSTIDIFRKAWTGKTS